MALIAALLRHQVDRDALRRAADGHRVTWAGSWSELNRLVRRLPVTAAFADVNAEPRKDGVLRVYRFGKRYPLTPLVPWGEVGGRELLRLGKAGARQVLTAREAEVDSLVRQTVLEAVDVSLAARIAEALPAGVAPEGRAFVRLALERVPDHAQVPDLADALGGSVSTLERRCERWGLPTPGRLLLWLRVLHALRWLQEPGRSVESVAEQLGYSSGAALRRAIKATLGGRPSPWRTEQGLDEAVVRFAAECRQEFESHGAEAERN